MCNNTKPLSVRNRGSTEDEVITCLRDPGISQQNRKIRSSLGFEGPIVQQGQNF